MRARTLLLVHAHPDDESLFTGGVIAHYAALGVRTVLVTCTLGQLGFDSQGREGWDPDHDAAATAATRAGELRRAATVLGVDRHVTLGFKDSGMSGWASNADPDAFVTADVEATARLLAAVIDQEDAQVVLTYDEHGFYGHPDHVAAHRVTRRAVELSARARRLFYPVVPRGVLDEFISRARDSGVYLPPWILEAVAETPDEAVAAVIDVAAVAPIKHRAIAAHASQLDNADLVAMDEEAFALLFGREYYQLGWERSPSSLACDDDLFKGLP